MIGTTVGSYCITEMVSVGGMGTVYKAEHTLIGKMAAVKVLHPELRSNREIVQRFFNEAKATTQIKHPGIVEIFDFGYLPSGDGYIVMEFLDGMSLANRLERDGKMTEGEAAVLMRGVCSALAAAHAKDIVHRDLKPDNIFVCPDPDAPTGERAKILDFGIAKLNVDMTGPKNATKTGAVMGTPTYMSPEQCKGVQTIDARSDLYSIGCMYYELVAGRPPFADMSAGELIGAHLFIEPPTPSSVGATISKETEQLVMQLLEKTADKRIQSALELGRRFAAIAGGAGLPSRATPIPTMDYRPTKPDAAVATPVPTPTPRPTPMPSTPSSPHRRSNGPEASAPTMASDSDLAAVSPMKTVSPTTLSGAASQSAAHSVIRPPQSRVGLFAGVAIAGIVGGFAVVMALNGKSAPSSSSGSPAVTPASAPVETAPPAPTPTPPAPMPAPVETPPAPVEAPPAPVEAPPVVTPEVKATPPVVQTKTKPPRQKPQIKAGDKVKAGDKAKTGDKAKAGDKAKGSGAGSASGKILIETDI